MGGLDILDNEILELSTGLEKDIFRRVQQLRSNLVSYPTDFCMNDVCSMLFSGSSSRFECGFFFLFFF